jgi:hypothetical protein
MRWSKVRKLVEESFAESVAGRVRVFSTHYSCSCGYGSIVVDGRQVAEFSTCLHFVGIQWVPDEDRPGWAREVPPVILDDERSKHPISVPREFSRFDLHRACWQLLHSNPHHALESGNGLLAALAALHNKVGVDRLRRMLDQDIHPLVRWAIDFRLDAERSTRSLAPRPG